MKGRIYISILLLLGFSVLVGHNLVPHRHHSDQLPCTDFDREEHHHVPDHYECEEHHHGEENHQHDCDEHQHECEEHHHECEDHHHGEENLPHKGENKPKHCHAFNDLDFVKFGSSQVPVPAGFDSCVAPGSAPHMHEWSGTAPTQLQLCLKLPLKLAPLKGSRSLRAPPLRG